MTILADIKPHETFIRNGIRYKYAAEIANGTLSVFVLHLEDGASGWTLTKTEWKKELARRRRR